MKLTKNTRNRIKKYACNPGLILERIFDELLKRGIFDSLSDEKYLKLAYFVGFRKKLNLNNPKTFSEKLQWLKLHDRREFYPNIVDKADAKEYVAEMIGDEYIIPTIGVWDSFDDINFNKLPNQFVVKNTADSGGVVVCKDKRTFNYDKTKEKVTASQKRSFYLGGREWPYSKLKPRILVEKYVDDLANEDLYDYKFFCFNGHVMMYKVDYDRFVFHRANYYSPHGELLPFGEVVCPPDFERKIVMPQSINKMIELAEKLSQGFKFLRVDFYCVNEKIMFGELTLYPSSGLHRFTSDDWDLKIGEWLNLGD